MTTPPTDAVTETVKHYLRRTQHVPTRLSRQDEPDELLAIRLAPDMFDTGLNFAVAIRFAARALCPPAGLEVPEIPDECTCERLRRFGDEVSELIAPIASGELRSTVSHTAGKATLEQEPADYVARFALPNMIFHLTLAYAGLRHGGMRLGKADFDGMHRY